MKWLRKLGYWLFITVVTIPTVVGFGFAMWGLWGFAVYDDKEAFINTLLGGSLLALGWTISRIPRWNAQQAAFRQESEERRRAAMRRGFQEWATSRGLTTTEADAIQVVDAQQTQLDRMWAR